MNNVIPPNAPSANDLTLIGPMPSPTPPQDPAGLIDTALLITLAGGGSMPAALMAQELLAWRWANCQANP